MLELINTPISALMPNPNDARTHSKKQLRQIAKSIKQFGFVNPNLSDEHGLIIARHGRFERFVAGISRAGKHQQIIVLTCRLRTFGPLGGHILRVHAKSEGVAPLRLSA
jgi:hypothetical protein